VEKAIKNIKRRDSSTRLLNLTFEERITREGSSSLIEVPTRLLIYTNRVLFSYYAWCMAEAGCAYGDGYTYYFSADKFTNSFIAYAKEVRAEGNTIYAKVSQGGFDMER